MKLKELLEILDKHVELGVYDRDGLHIRHFYDDDDDDDYPKWSKEFLEKEVIELEPFIDFDIVKRYSFPPASLAIYLEDYYDTNDCKNV